MITIATGTSPRTTLPTFLTAYFTDANLAASASTADVRVNRSDIDDPCGYRNDYFHPETRSINGTNNGTNSGTISWPCHLTCNRGAARRPRQPVSGTRSTIQFNSRLLAICRSRTRLHQ